MRELGCRGVTPRILKRTFAEGNVVDIVRFAAGLDLNPNSPLDDGTVIAQYGKTKVYVNLGDVPRTVGGYAVFDVASKSGEPVLTIEYACQCGRAVSRRFRTMTPGSARGDA